ncbi:MAG: NYN domain-containing protein [Ilumatobacter sp.]|nr:NYN domain-containing protein [Ilumatobacter sp.]
MTAIDHRQLRSALEFAVLIAAEGQKRRPPRPFPKELKPFLSQRRLAGTALGRVRRAVEGDPTFRAAIFAGALPELVDEVGRLWLGGAEGWEDAAAEIVLRHEADADSIDVRRDLKRSEKRRAAAEQAAARIQIELLQRDATIAEHAAELDALRSEGLKARDEIDRMRAELIDTRNEIRHARDREAAAVARAEVAASARLASSPRAAPPDSAPDSGQPDAAEARRRLIEAIEASREFVAHLNSLLIIDEKVSEPVAQAQRGSQRTAVVLPGGVISTSAEAARHLVAAGAPIFIDGYNVAKLGWPDRGLEDQRNALIDRAENVARRHAAEITIVFDGASVVGAHAPRRRHVRVVFSPEGVTADDVIRAEVGSISDEVPVVVVTNDREIVADVKAAGANVVPSNAFIAAL